MNGTHAFASELLGRGYVTKKDLLIGWTIVCYLQLLFGASNLYILKKITIFHNAFGFLCATRTTIEMLSSLLHISYSGPVTLTQVTGLPPFLGLFVGAAGYFLSAMSCSLHVLLSFNRFTAVCHIFQYQTLFSISKCKKMVAALAMAMVILDVSYYVLPCNMLGFSAKHYGYVVIGCEDGRQPSFNVGTVFNYLCWISFCTGAIVVDLCTFVKILKLRKVRNLDNDKMFQRNVRFFAQSAFQNIPMFIDIALLSLGDNSLLEDKALFRIISFSLTRFTDLINSTALILFNPEARKHILKMIKKQNVIPVAISAIAPSTTIGLAGARSSQL
ncbi:hypothetical protein QR680_015542 [Steinernema hermaphroditum]|uniref:7TM GPCR serpentine receptor class x (Srx) domain-containing protein n=1 Tax=Steinernema hermaphroditum TaxID=289476 RepID=A0AA39H834_9BILA|nr:hypothetical protein QR680_015542 [Steinernema hermaphroditum]